MKSLIFFFFLLRERHGTSCKVGSADLRMQYSQTKWHHSTYMTIFWKGLFDRIPCLVKVASNVDWCFELFCCPSVFSWSHADCIIRFNKSISSLSFRNWLAERFKLQLAHMPLWEERHEFEFFRFRRHEILASQFHSFLCPVIQYW